MNTFFIKKITAIVPLILFFLLIDGCETEEKEQLPNIVIIYTDDQGYGDIGTFGATGFTTPNLDKMAHDGMLFTHFYSAQAVCSASRAALLTGCYPNRIGIHGALMPTAEHGIHKDEVTIAEMLKTKGYATGIFGKWHLGHHEKFLPLQHGFDEYVGIPYSNDMWPVDFDGTPVTEDSSRPWKTRYPPLPLIVGNNKSRELTTIEDQGILSTLYTEKAVDFIRRHKDGPFFLYVPHSMPHVPLGVSGKFKGKSEQGMYGDVMMEIDWSVGAIIKVLEENGIDDNTLVIFTTDNGPWLNFGNHAGSTGGLREGKGTSFEGGQRIPCIIKWAGHIPEGKICNKMAATLDIMPTLAEITGASLPDHKIDGISILSLLKGEENANPRDHLYYYYQKNSLEAVRKDHWKLVFPHPSRSYEGIAPGNDGWPGEYNQIETELALYDLRRDPGEEYDVKEQYPEIVSELEELASQARTDMGDELTGAVGTGIRDCGWITEE
ncbi:MAG: sulfatase [Cyclobacteriaceae bacterium]|nr:sulfatase [Cyclobacteriaceae bacterium]